MLREIAEHRGINLIEVQPGDELCKANGEDSYIDHSYVCGNDRIELGIYTDPEKRLISFFHEMGHILTPKQVHKRCNTVYEIEEKAWKYGYKLAKFYGIEFNKETKDWAKEQLNSYIGYEEREMGRLYSFKAKEIIFYCQDIVRIHTANRRDDEDYWTELDHKKFKAHLAISRILWESYNKKESEPKDWVEIKNIHDNIQFITTDLRKSINFEFKKNYTLKEIEDYSEKLAKVITDYVKSCQWVDLIKPRFTFNQEELNKIKWVLPDIDEA